MRLKFSFEKYLVYWRSRKQKVVENLRIWPAAENAMQYLENVFNIR